MTEANTSATPGRKADGKKLGFFAGIILFFRQVLDELKKVRWPNRSEWWTFFLVVLVFVAVIMAYTGLLDVIFGELSAWIFG